MLAQAHADREQAHRLEIQLHGIKHQLRLSHQAHQKAAAAAKQAAQHRQTAPLRARKARQRHQATGAHHSSLAQEAKSLRGRIDTLLTQANQLTVEAGKL